jgi:type II secretory pathway pseudopilin PulG
MRRNNFLTNKDSFTLVELLVVIGILAILTAAVVIVLNPAELLKQSRDSKRTTDLANLNNAIKLLLTQNPDVNLGAASTVYLSLSDSSSTCGSYSLPALPSGWRYQCATAANYQKIDGAGWIPINFSSTGNVASLPTLPTDPQNTGLYYYSYVAGGSWEIATMFESKKYAAKAQSDAGSDPERLEVGSNLALWNNAYGLVGYWPFDEGSGSVAYDKSGSGNNGNLFNGPAWQSDANCESGGCLSFDGVDDYVEVPRSTALEPAELTISVWAKKMNNVATAYDQVLVCKYTDSHPIYGYCATWGWSDDFYWRIGNGTTEYNAGAPTVSWNRWHHIAVTFKNGQQLFFLDGKLMSETLVATNIGYNGSSLYIGKTSSRRLQGLIDDVRIYNRVLSAAEIQAIYNATK